jgi:5-methylthioribose kinase
MNSIKAKFESAHPRGAFLDPGAPAAIESYCRAHGFLKADEVLLSVSKAGEGNMNLTLRLSTEGRSIILKQARPWVEKYPSIPAPPGRALVEAAFYRAIAKRPELRAAMPSLLGEDPDSGVIVLQDLGEAQDFTGLYRGDRLSEREMKVLSSYLSALHRPTGDREPLFENRAMRALNHEHIFRLPLAPDNGLDLDRITPGLEAAARTLRQDRGYVSRVRELGELYLTDGPSLVHGDYFPGSWLRTADGVRVIDPEFCFLGTAAFDRGVLLAHLYLARQRPELSGFDSTAKAFAGAEILRRLIGVAQLPLDARLEEKEELLALSKRLVLS